MTSETLKAMPLDLVMMLPEYFCGLDGLTGDKYDNIIIRESQPLKMGLQISCGIYPTREEESAVWKSKEIFSDKIS